MAWTTSRLWVELLLQLQPATNGSAAYTDATGRGRPIHVSLRKLRTFDYALTSVCAVQANSEAPIQSPSWRAPGGIAKIPVAVWVVN